MISPKPIPSVLPANTVKQNNSARGLMLMACGMFLFSACDAIAKLLTDTIHPFQIVWSRQCGLFLGVLILIAIRGFTVLKSQNRKLQITRGVLASISATLFIVAVAYVPLADAVAITFIAPFMVTLMGALILKERVGIRRWIAVAVGFLGMLIVVRPGMSVIHPAAILLVIAVTAFALRQVLSRALSGSDNTSTTVAYTAIVSWSILTIPALTVWQIPATNLEIALLIAIAVLAAGAETLVIMALDAAQAVVVAPVQYTLLIWGTLYGYLVFGQLPDMLTLIGALILVATGLYTLNLERLAIAGKS